MSNETNQPIDAVTFLDASDDEVVREVMMVLTERFNEPALVRAKAVIDSLRTLASSRDGDRQESGQDGS